MVEEAHFVYVFPRAVRIKLGRMSIKFNCRPVTGAHFDSAKNVEEKKYPNSITAITRIWTPCHIFILVFPATSTNYALFLSRAPVRVNHTRFSNFLTFCHGIANWQSKCTSARFGGKPAEAHAHRHKYTSAPISTWISFSTVRVRRTETEGWKETKTAISRRLNWRWTIIMKRNHVQLFFRYGCVCTKYVIHLY